MKGKNSKALSDNQAAAESLDGWSIAAALHSLTETWRPSLDGIRDRARAGAANLRASASGHEWNDDLVSHDFEKTPDTAMSSPAGPGVSSAVGYTWQPSPAGKTLPDPGFASPSPDFPSGGAYQPPVPGTKAPSVDDMLDAKPVTPVYEPGVTGATTRDGHQGSPQVGSDSPFG
ncbi:hypothetical protein DY245_42995 [Streptomyces inhibens]|uniref:Uncharacterized protein n=2 Tax=Streptomyces inhibens TaxID=2293571 RepID=A0A371PPU2_STRIH|nr:hypothetical protein DY245_42995 [Streptomyces inhibens]